ncbi:MAG: 50S ribosomal protein L3 [Gammaproteobacteria bacterium]|nr:50S ribosomal protein L3 [Gammaproteobacteria bacterium]
MAIGIVGKKRGMTRVFSDNGTAIPVTVIEAVSNRVTRLIDHGDGAPRSVQVAWGTKRRSLLNKPFSGILAKAEVDAAEGVVEFRLGAGEGQQLAPGAQINVDVFNSGQKVDVRGTTIGKGFAGTIKRHHFSRQRASHGASLAHRTPGSVGQNQSPGRVFKGKRMPGHLGNALRTIQNLEVVRVDPQRSLILIRGAVPGPSGGKVIVTPTLRTGKKKGQR